MAEMRFLFPPFCVVIMGKAGGRLLGVAGHHGLNQGDSKRKIKAAFVTAFNKLVTVICFGLSCRSCYKKIIDISRKQDII